MTNRAIGDIRVRPFLSPPKCPRGSAQIGHTSPSSSSRPDLGKRHQGRGIRDADWGRGWCSVLRAHCPTGDGALSSTPMDPLGFADTRVARATTRRISTRVGIQHRGGRPGEQGPPADEPRGRLTTASGIRPSREACTRSTPSTTTACRCQDERPQHPAEHARSWMHPWPTIFSVPGPVPVPDPRRCRSTRPPPRRRVAEVPWPQ